MENGNKKSSIFIRYLFSYIIILLIPVAIMSSVIYNDFIVVLKNEVADNSLNMLEQVKNVTDSRVDELVRITATISSNYKLSPFSISESEYNRLDAYMELRDYGTLNSFIEDILLYIRGKNDIISATAGTYSLEHYSNVIYKYNQWNSEDFYKKLNEISSPTVFSAQNVIINNATELRAVVYMFPISPQKSEFYGTVAYIINEEKMKSIFKDIIKKYEGNTLILDSSNQCIAALRRDNLLESEEFISLTNEIAGRGSRIVGINRSQYFVNYVQSESNSWKYLNIVPMENIFLQVLSIEKKMIYTLAFIFLCASALILYAMRLNYKPVQNLFDKFDKMANQNKILLQQKLILNLVKGSARDYCDFMKIADDTGVNLRNSNYFIVFILFEENNFENNSNIAERAKKIIFEEDTVKSIIDNASIYNVDTIQNNTLILLFSVHSYNSEESREELEGLKSQLSERLSVRINMGVGDVYNDIMKIPLSYLEATTALNYRFILGKDQIIYFKDSMIYNQEMKWYPKAEMESLSAEIAMGNADKVNIIIKSILTDIKKVGMHLFWVKLICYELVNTVLRTAAEMKIDLQNADIDHVDFIKIAESETIMELEGLLNNLCRIICTYIVKGRESGNYHLRDSILNYVKENYSDCNFTVEKTAEHFRISYSYLSRFFKEQTGQTITDYLVFLRIEKAKELLLLTDIPVKDIISQVGYMDVNSFTRRFKALENLAPGQYREAYKIKEDRTYTQL